MVTPGAKRDAVAHAREHHGLSERRACNLNTFETGHQATGRLYVARYFLSLSCHSSALGDTSLNFAQSGHRAPGFHFASGGGHRTDELVACGWAAFGVILVGARTRCAGGRVRHG